MRVSQFILILFVTILVAWSVSHLAQPKGKTVAEKETVYERVMRTRTLRCGYVIYPPLLIKDMNTGEFSGIAYDIVTKIAELTKLKIEWTTESSWANYTQDLTNKKFDALCTLDFFPPVLVGRVENTQPLFLTTIGVYKKAGDTRFITGSREFNDPKITFSAIDGSLAMLVRDADYPKSKIVSLPANSDYSVILENIANGKADLTFVERAFANNYMKVNPGKIEDITGNRPVVAYPYIFPTARGETELSNLFDQAITLMQFNGDIEKTLNKYAPGNYIPIDPYKNYKM